MNDFKVIPFKGVDTGNAFFELMKSYDDINKKYDLAGKVMIDNILKITIEYRLACELKYRHTAKNKLVAITCNKHTNPMFEDKPLFSLETIEFLKENYEYIEGKHYITFPEIGISIGGMGQKKIPEGKVVIVFDKSETETYIMFAKGI